MKKNITRTIYVLLSLFIMQSNVFAQSNDLLTDIETSPVIQDFENGKVNWTEQYVEAIGFSVLDTARFKNPAQARAMAQRGAVVVAQRNLLEIVQGVNINSETTVKDFMIESDIIKTKIEGVLKGATIVGEAVEKFGMIEVTMRVPLYAGNSIANVIYDHEKAKLPIDKTNTTPVEVVIEDKKATKKNKNSKKAETEKKQETIAPDTKGGKIEQLFFNIVEGENISPALFPDIKGMSGETVLNLLEQYDPTSGKFPEMVKISKAGLSKLQNNPEAMIVDVIRDASGKFVVDVKNQERIEKWKNIGNKALKLAAGILF